MTTMRLLLPALLLFSACGTHSAIEASHDYSRVGDHKRAYDVLEEARNDRANAGRDPSPELEEAHHKAKVAFLLDRAQQNIFEEKEDLALADLAQLKQIAPDDPVAQALANRAYEKKAMRSVERGDDMLLRKDLHNALVHYLAALRVVPDFPPAIDGSDRVREAMMRLTERAQIQFLEAVRKMPEFRYVEVRWHADIAMANDPEREDAEGLRKRAHREIALRAQERGRQCEEREQFGAALLEYRTARKLDPTLPGIDDLVARNEREVAAATLVEQAQRSMRMQQFPLARDQLGKALALSTMTKTHIVELTAQCRRLESEAKYQVARDQEVLGKKAEALAIYEAIQKDWPDGLVDEKARIEGLRIDIAGATAEWEAAEFAEKANDPAKALSHYEAAMQYYPGWKDGPARVQRLRQQVAPKPDGR